MAGSYYAHTGGGSNFLCMTKDPEWLNTDAGAQSASSSIYGAEFRISEQLFNHTYVPTVNYQDVVCAVCQSKIHMTQVYFLKWTVAIYFTSY